VNTIPPSVLRYFWLIVATGLLINVAMIHIRAGALVRAGQIDERERQTFSRGAALILVGICLLFQVIVWLSGEGRPECLAAFPPTTSASWASSVVTVLAWGALLWWVWRGSGAGRLARLGPVLFRSRVTTRSYSATQVRDWVTILVMLALVGGAVVSRLVPPPSDCGSRPGSGTSTP
jgi:hypothetical protein